VGVVELKDLRRQPPTAVDQRADLRVLRQDLSRLAVSEDPTQPILQGIGQ
jgi:hypothetical protein